MRVLLVKAEEIIGSGAQTALRQVGYAVDWLQDGQFAATALQTERFDLVVLDQGLPRRQTCRRQSGTTCSPTCC